MTTTSTTGVVDRFRAGQAFSESFNILLRNLLPFGGIAFAALGAFVAFVFGIVGLVGGGFGALLLGDTAAIDGMVNGSEIDAAAIAVFSAALLAVFVGYFVMTQVATAAITYGAVQHLRGRKAGIGDCFRIALSTLPSAIAVSLVIVLIAAAIVAVPFGALFIVASDIASDPSAIDGGRIGLAILAVVIAIIALTIIMIRYWLAIPVVVIERPGILNSLRRSAFLTKGKRWRILGLYGLLAVVGMAISMVIELPLSFVVDPAVGEIVNLVITGFTTALAAVVAAVGYYHLRVEKEGAQIEDIAEVFD